MPPYLDRGTVAWGGPLSAHPLVPALRSMHAFRFVFLLPPFSHPRDYCDRLPCHPPPSNSVERLCARGRASILAVGPPDTPHHCDQQKRARGVGTPRHSLTMCARERLATRFPIAHPAHPPRSSMSPAAGHGAPGVRFHGAAAAAAGPSPRMGSVAALYPCETMRDTVSCRHAAAAACMA